MNVKQLQDALNKRGVNPPLDADGLPGRKTMAAVDAALDGIDASGWSDERCRIAVEQLIYKEAKIEVGSIDGLVGEQTRYAREVWVARQSGDPNKVAAVEHWRDADANKPAPTPPVSANKWPKQSESEMTGFFGARGANQARLVLPFPQRIAWEPSQTITSVSCNAKCRDAFNNVWKNTLDHYGYDEIKKLRLDMYGGCLNVRKVRGSASTWSIHSWGAAWDVDPERNQFKWKGNLATLDSPQYKKFWEIVASEGGQSLGKLRDYDWMHFQFARF